MSRRGSSSLHCMMWKYSDGSCGQTIYEVPIRVCSVGRAVCQ